MSLRDIRDDAERLLGTLGKCAPHHVVAVLVALDDEVGVITQDRTSPDVVSEGADRFLDPARDGLALTFVEPDDVVLEEALSAPMEAAKFPSSWLHGHPPVMDLTELAKELLADLIRSTASDIVWEPVSVPHQHEVMGDDDAGGSGRNVHSQRLDSLRDDA